MWRKKVDLDRGPPPKIWYGMAPYDGRLPHTTNTSDAVTLTTPTVVLLRPLIQDL